MTFEVLAATLVTILVLKLILVLSVTPGAVRALILMLGVFAVVYAFWSVVLG
jgi:hypothetical protein